MEGGSEGGQSPRKCTPRPFVSVINATPALSVQKSGETLTIEGERLTPAHWAASQATMNSVHVRTCNSWSGMVSVSNATPALNPKTNAEMETPCFQPKLRKDDGRK